MNPSARVWNLALSPSAFWMSNCTPAEVNASPRYLRSAVSHRAEDAESGRITPILPAPPAAAELDPPAAAEVEALPPDELLPHAVRAREPTAMNARVPTRRLRMLRSFLGPSSVPGQRPTRSRGRITATTHRHGRGYVVAHNLLLDRPVEKRFSATHRSLVGNDCHRQMLRPSSRASGASRHPDTVSGPASAPRHTVPGGASSRA